MSLLVYSSAVFAVGAVFLYFVTLPSRRLLPPGPPRDPFIGNLRQMPSEEVPLVFHEWGKTYGDVIYLKIPGQSIIVLNSLKAAEDLLDKRSLIYSDRPKFPLYELFGWNPALTLLPYGKKLAKFRQTHQAYLSRQKCVDYKPMLTQEARMLAKNLLTCESDEYESYLSRFATGVITQIVAGHRIKSDDDPYLRMSKMVLESLVRASQIPAGTAIDFFPFLQHFPSWFPGTHYANVAREWQPTMRELYTFPVETVKKQKAAGLAPPSFILTQLEAMETWESVTPEDQQDLRGNTATMFTAGEGTTWDALSIFLLAMVLYPECQLKAQKEIESVIGTSRLPEFADREKLLYVECLYQEIFRWNTGTPLALPHRCMEDDTYRGMFIPAGSIVFPNIRGMTLDESIYSDPTTFSPERYLPKPLGNSEPYFTGRFGFGRRICTGQYLADNSVWVTVATILASCRITNAVDKNGMIIVPVNAMSYGLMSHPVEFQCVIEPRTPQAKSLVAESINFESVGN
ncbi:cytochrome P450 [Mycena epipterygia]|nr:cytochrome P450 [Mycena epipterygia]